MFPRSNEDVAGVFEIHHSEHGPMEDFTMHIQVPANDVYKTSTATARWGLGWGSDITVHYNNSCEYVDIFIPVPATEHRELVYYSDRVKACVHEHVDVIKGLQDLVAEEVLTQQSATFILIMYYSCLSMLDTEIMFPFVSPLFMSKNSGLTVLKRYAEEVSSLPDLGYLRIGELLETYTDVIRTSEFYGTMPDNHLYHRLWEECRIGGHEDLLYYRNAKGES